MDPGKLAVGALVALVAASPVLRFLTNGRAGGQESRLHLVLGITMIAALALGTFVVLAWAIKPVLPGEFNFGDSGLPYFIGDGGVNGSGPGDVGCETLSAVQKPGALPLVAVGYLTWVERSCGCPQPRCCQRELGRC